MDTRRFLVTFSSWGQAHAGARPLDLPEPALSDLNTRAAPLIAEPVTGIRGARLTCERAGSLLRANARVTLAVNGEEAHRVYDRMLWGPPVAVLTAARESLGQPVDWDSEWVVSYIDELRDLEPTEGEVLEMH